MEQAQLTHFNASGRARMIDVTTKEKSMRTAVAEGKAVMSPATLVMIENGTMGKGDVLAVAQVAGIIAAKRTWDIIPMCHPLLLTYVNLEFIIDNANNAIVIRALVKTSGLTGVEMEALTAVAAAALTIYDMCKAVDHGITIESIRLISKTGGKSGAYIRGGD